MRKCRVSIMLVAVMLLSMVLPQVTVGAEALSSCKISGYVSPDFLTPDNSATVKKSGFNVELLGTGLSTATDSDGYFELAGLQPGSYRLKISKTAYLTREADIDLEGDRQISEKVSPLDMWVGDLQVAGGVQDNCINLYDIMEFTKVFSSSQGDGRYKEEYDFDNDTVINFAEMMMIAKNFNKTSSSYLPLVDPLYKDSSLPVEERVENLLSQMTLEEKVGQMIQGERDTTSGSDVKNYYLGSILSGGGSAPASNTPEGWMEMCEEFQSAALSTRLGIPILYGTDAVHGNNNLYGSVMFPHNIGLGAAADPELMTEIGKVTAEEMLSTGVTWNFSPCIAVARDERWGRTYESYSENPELVSMLSIPLYETLQKEYGITTTAKHFIADGGTTGGVDQGDAVISEEELRRIHLPVYKKAVDAGVKTVMVSFSSWNGVKDHENKYLITDVLKGELGFKGFVVSDWEAIHQIDANNLYGQVVKAVNAGVDMLMEPNSWKDCFNIINSAVIYRDISRDRIDDAVRRILKVKFEMGMFEKPLGDQSLITSEVGSAEHREVAKKAARESLVLLKNSGNVLPLKKNAKIFVTGPAANDVGVQCGGWTLSWLGGIDSPGYKWMKGTTILEGFQKIANQSGGTIITDPSKAGEADVAVVVIGERPYAEKYGDDDNNLALTGGKVVLSGNLEAIKTAKDAGLPVVVVMVSGRPRIVSDQINNWDAFVEAWLPGTEGDAVPEVLYGDYDFRGKLPCTWPASYAQLPINVDDMGDKVPLFPYGYGLTMSSSTPTATATPTQPSTTPTPTSALTFLSENTTPVGDWSLYSVSNTEVSANAVDVGAEANIVKTGTSEDDIKLIHTEPYSLESGKYELKLFVTSSIDRDIRVALEKDDETMEAVMDEEVALKSGENSITIPFDNKADISANLSLRLGYFAANGGIAPHTVTVGGAEFVRTGDYVNPSAPPSEDPNRYKNKITNGDFSNSTNGWWGIEEQDGSGVLNIEGGTVNPWDVMCGNYLTFQLQKGRTYKVSFDLASEKAQYVKFQIVNADNNDSELTLRTFDVPGDAVMHTYTFDDFEVAEDCAAKIAFQVGGYGAPDETYKINIDNADVHEVPKMVDAPVTNGDFSGGTNGWWGISSIEGGVGVLNVEGGTANPWDVMCGNYLTFPLQKGRTYSVSFDLASDKEQDIRFQVVNADNNDSELANRVYSVPGDSTFHTYTFDDFEVGEDCAAKFAFMFGGFGAEGESYSVKMDNVRFSYPDLSIPVVIDDPKSNMVKNFDFAAGTKNWGLYTMYDGDASFKAVDGEGVLNITNMGTQDYSVQFYQDGMKLYKGNKYKLSFRYKADTERTGEVRIQQNGGTYEGYLDDKALEFTTDWKTYEKEFTMTYDNDTSARLCFNLGKEGEAAEIDQNIYFDDFSLVMTEGSLPEEEKSSSIRLNQVGYLTDGEKVAFVVSKERTFKLYTGDDKLVMTGNLPLYTVDSDGNALVDPASGDIVRKADFTSIKTDGNYYLKVRADKSPAFAVGQEVYGGLTAAVLKMFYYQRCGGDGLDAEYAGDVFAHAPCHTGTAVYYDPTDPTYGSVEADVSGGWHDAGDYGRYVTSAAKSVADLLLTAEYFPAINDLDFGGPDKILGETRYELEWMLKMQNPVTGGVYHKVTTRNHAAMTILPEDDSAQLYLSPVSAQAAGDFAAVMASASRLYKAADADFAAKCLDAAENAWSWLKANPAVDVYADPSFFGTGTYNDNNSQDERFWAATELYRATGEGEYLDYIDSNVLPKAGFGWADMGSYAMVAYLSTEGVDKNGSLYRSIEDSFIADADKAVDTWKKDGYKVAMDTYVWGSNMDLCDRAITMIIADKLDPKPDYKAAVMDQLDYIMGRNANNTSYVTGFGENAAKHPHHRLSIIKGQAVPGMLVGGPNGSIMAVDGDPVSKMVDENTPPAKCYADVDGSYATNEICVYWNSPLVFMLGYLYEQ